MSELTFMHGSASGPVDDALFVAAAEAGDAARLAALLDAHPDRLHLPVPPYDGTLLHVAAHHGHLPVVELLLLRGFDPDVREGGDHTTPMHWAAAAGDGAPARRAGRRPAGGGRLGRDGGRPRDGARRGPPAARGDRPHDGGRAAERRARAPRRARRRARPRRGARARRPRDGGAAARRRRAAARRGRSVPRGAAPPRQARRRRGGGVAAGARRRPERALVALGAEVTPLHLAAMQGHVAVLRRLLGAGADRAIRDSAHDGTALGWAEHFGRVEAVRMLGSG